MRRLAGRVLAYVLLVVVAVIGFAPFVYLLIISTKRRIDIVAEVPPSLNFNVDQIVRNYSEVINSQGMLSFTGNSIIVVGISTLVALIIGVPAAYAFSRLRFRGRDAWASTVLSFRFMPPVAVAIPIFLMIRSIGFSNSYPGLIIPYVAFTLPLVIWIMIGFFDEVPRDIDDAALVDGCGRVEVLWRVLLPIVGSGIIVSAIFGAIFIWNEFLVALYIINSRSLQTVTLGAATLVSAQRPIDWNIAAAVGIVTLIPIFLFSLFIQRYVVRGITAGAVR
ncbi:MAG: carbohydrate ABC transporter permease [Chloroflexi bacterium]|nr:carbohydrate ABC transporter permease [Chloroflexota bacterium]